MAVTTGANESECVVDCYKLQIIILQSILVPQKTESHSSLLTGTHVTCWHSRSIEAHLAKDTVVVQPGKSCDVLFGDGGSIL